MSLAELVEAVGRETGLSKAQVSKVLRATLKTMVGVLKTGERVVLPGFGTFFHKDVKPSTIFGGRVQTRVRRKIKFRQSRGLP